MMNLVSGLHREKHNCEIKYRLLPNDLCEIVPSITRTRSRIVFKTESTLKSRIRSETSHKNTILIRKRQYEARRCSRQT